MFVPENPYSNELEDLFDSSQLDRLTMFNLNPGQTLQVRIIEVCISFCAYLLYKKIAVLLK